jgi:phosphoserine phosphatase RsbU/P
MEQRIEVPAIWDSVTTLMDFTDVAERNLSLTADQCYILRLVVEEIATNIIKYGYSDDDRGTIQLICLCQEQALTIKIRDQGKPFDPRDPPDPDLTTDLDERSVGGLGIFFVREYADSIDYQHDPATGWNELTVVKGRVMLVDQLARIPLFQKLAPNELEAMAASLGERNLAAGEVLFRQGDIGYDCYVIISGGLEVITHVAGNEVQLEVRNPGQIIGEMALLDRSPRSAMVRAVADTHVAVMDERNFMLLLASDPALALSMLRDGTTRIRNTNHRMITDLEQKNAQLVKAYEELKAAQGELIRLNRIEEELAVARRIQQSFLPRSLPQPKGWRIAAFSRSAQSVGGDFFDCIELQGGKLGLVVADACGKGVTAALFVALTRSLLRSATVAPWTFQGSMPLDADSVLTGALWLTNDYISREHSASDMFITLYYAVLDPANGRLAYVNAGHNPPLLVRQGGTLISETDEGTLPIGIMPSQDYNITETGLEAGDTLVAFSDGITEAMNQDGEPFGDERLHAVLREHAHLDAQALVARIVEVVDAYAGGAPQADDMTLLIAQRNML